jgi:hypothetical protein
MLFYDLTTEGITEDIMSSTVKKQTMEDNTITERIISCAIKVHPALGSGLLESAYKECLYYELKKMVLL